MFDNNDFLLLPISAELRSDYTIELEENGSRVIDMDKFFYAERPVHNYITVDPHFPIVVQARVFDAQLCDTRQRVQMVGSVIHLSHSASIEVWNSVYDVQKRKDYALKQLRCDEERKARS